MDDVSKLNNINNNKGLMMKDLKCEVCGDIINSPINEIRTCTVCGIFFCHGCASLGIDICDFCVEHIDNTESEV